MDYKFQRRRIDKMPESKILEELEKAAKHFNYIEFGHREFDEVADICESTVRKHFGTWKNAIEVLRKHLREKGLDLSPHSLNRISNKELFDEMERVWQKVGQRPSVREWEMSEPRFSYHTYTQRFGGWAKSCLGFIEYKMGGNIFSDDKVDRDRNAEVPSNKNVQKVCTNIENSRAISPGVRLKVLDRDNFRCVFCGRSPATDIGVRLHIDHKLPFSKGGKSTIDNLQTLCQDCNLGKSDEVIGSPKI